MSNIVIGHLDYIASLIRPSHNTTKEWGEIVKYTQLFEQKFPLTLRLTPYFYQALPKYIFQIYDCVYEFNTDNFEFWREQDLLVSKWLIYIESLYE